VFQAKADIVRAEKCRACTALDISYIGPLGSAGCSTLKVNTLLLVVVKRIY